MATAVPVETSAGGTNGQETPPLVKPKRRIVPRVPYWVGRIIRALLTIYVVSTATFFLIRMMPGNPVAVFITQKISEQGISYEDAAAQATALFKFDPSEPLILQYIKYLGQLVKGDLGDSMLAPGTSVMSQITGYVPWTLFSVGTAVIIAFILGIALGLMMAYRRGGIFDHVMTFLASLTHSIPNFLLAIMIIVFFGVQLQWIPVGDMRGSVSEGVEIGFNLEFFMDAMFHASIPIFVYVLTSIGGWMLVMKSSTIETLGEDYVTVARARGLTDGRIQAQYVGRNAILPLFTSFVLTLGFVVGGSILVESVTQYQGIGYLLNQSVGRRDYTVLQGILLVLTISVILANLIADLLYGWIDPRIRVAGKES